MKQIISLFIIGVIFPCPDGFYEDDCGTCWMPYCYNYISHDVFYDLDEDECDGNNELWVLPGTENDLFFNNYCDGNCPDNFISDNCNSCWNSFCYSFFSPGLNGDPPHSVYYDLTLEECESYGYNYYSPDHPSNPYWNSNCNDNACDDLDEDGICDDEDECIGLIDDCGECLSGYCYDYVTHEVSFGECDGATQMWVDPDSPSNPYWNASCNEEWAQGDVNQDGNVNVIDITSIVYFLVFGDPVVGDADINGDDNINVVDIVQLVNIIQGGTARVDDATDATITIAGDILSVDGNGFIQGAQLSLRHEGLINVELTNEYIAEYYTEGNTTTLVVVTDGTKSLTDIATISGSYEITEVIIANSQSEVATQLDIQVAGIELTAAYPNPFNPSTSLDLVIPEAGFVSVKVYNLVGQEVATLAEGMMQATSGYTLTWNANNMPSGVYLVRAEGAGSVATQKLMLLK